MSYIKKQLLPNEEIVYQTQPHWIIFMWPILFTVVTPLLFYRHMQPEFIATATLIFTVIAWIIAYTKYITSEFVITNRRVILKEGLLRVVVVERSLAKIESITIEQTIPGRFLNYGKVIFTGVGGSYDVLPVMTGPEKFKQALQKQLNTNISDSK